VAFDTEGESMPFNDGSAVVVVDGEGLSGIDISLGNFIAQYGRLLVQIPRG